MPDRPRFPVVVGHGRDVHLGDRLSDRTYCGRLWTATTDGNDNGVTCRPCRTAYAAGHHPPLRNGGSDGS